MVGTRHPDEACVQGLTALIRDVVSAGVGVVSGAAFGIDTLAHRTAAEAGGETWAFVGSSLDALDTHPKKLWQSLRETGATFWSELPPGVRADRRTFPRRNRLISGAADAVAVLRAGRLSGTRYTARYALAHGRPLLAWPAEPKNPNGELCLELIKLGHATMCTSVDDVLEAVGLGGVVTVAPPLKMQVDEAGSLSDDARMVLGQLERTPKCFDELLLLLPMQSPRLVTSLVELTLAGLVIEQAGRRYLRV
jgi:DNA processing protein